MSRNLTSRYQTPQSDPIVVRRGNGAGDFRCVSLAAAALALICIAPAQADVAYQRIVASGDIASDGSDALEYLNNSVINDAGQIAFTADYTGFTGAGVFLYDGGAIDTIVRDGDAAPGAAEAAFTFISDPVINANGLIAFKARYHTPSGDGEGVFTYRGGTLDDVAHTDAGNAPGAPGPFKDIREVRLNDQDHIMVAAAYDDGSKYGTPGYWTTSSGALSALAIAGNISIIDGDPDKTLVNTSDPFAFTHSGRMVWYGGYKDDGAARDAVFTATHASGVTIAFDGSDPVPGVAGQSFYTIWAATGAANDQVVFIGRYGFDEGVFLGTVGGAFTDIARSDGPSAPQVGQAFTAFDRQGIRVNADGDVAFIATYSGGNGIFLKKADGDLTAIAVVGQTIAGGDAIDGDFDELVLNANGQIAFIARIASGGRGLWATDIDGILHLIARSGQQWDLDGLPGGEAWTIDFIDFAGGSGGGDGLSSGFNDLGQITFGLELVDPSDHDHSAIYVATVPEPASLALLGLTGCLMFATQRRTDAIS